MNPFISINWPATGVMVDDENSLRNALANAQAGVETLVEVRANINLTNPLDIHAGRIIKITSYGGPCTINASGNIFGILNVYTDTAPTTVYFENITLRGGTGFPSGGAIRSIGANNALIALEGDAILEDNTSNDGGAIALEKGAVGLFGGILRRNHAYAKGGAIYVAEGCGVDDAAFVMESGTISQNTANQSGGGVYIEKEKHEAIITDGTISGNTCDINGGGLYVQDLEMSGGSITNNLAKVQGGGIYLNGEATISGTLLSDNNSEAGGGAIFMRSDTNSKLTLSDQTEISNNRTETGPLSGGGIYVIRDKLADLFVGEDVFFSGNSAVLSTPTRRPEDEAVYTSNIKGAVWSIHNQGYNNYDISYYYEDDPPPCPAVVTFVMSKDVIGTEPRTGEFEFGIFDANQAEVLTGTSNSHGAITFPGMVFTEEGVFNFTVKETSAPPGWIVDDTIFDITVTVELSGNCLFATVAYPGTTGAPVFTNTWQSDTCGKIVFSGITLDEPGVYDFTIRELTPSGGGWVTDPTIIPVTVTVIDDGNGNLVATTQYPEGYPSFTNTYTAVPACVTISACKIAIGADLPSGRFNFGLFDSNGDLVKEATNGPAKETILT